MYAIFVVILVFLLYFCVLYKVKSDKNLDRFIEIGT